MSPEERDPALIWDMLDAARTVLDIVQGRSDDALAADRVRMLALERSFEVIDEAARRVNEVTRSAHAGIPWKAIIGQRNIIAHEYGSIDHQRLIETAKRDVPNLIVALEKVLATDDPAG